MASEKNPEAHQNITPEDAGRAEKARLARDVSRKMATDAKEVAGQTFYVANLEKQGNKNVTLKDLFDTEYVLVRREDGDRYAKKDSKGEYRYADEPGKGVEIKTGDVLQPSDLTKAWLGDAQELTARQEAKEKTDRSIADMTSPKMLNPEPNFAVSSEIKLPSFAKLDKVNESRKLANAEADAKREAFAKKLDDPRAKAAYDAAYDKNFIKDIGDLIAQRKLNVNSPNSWMEIHDAMLQKNPDYLAVYKDRAMRQVDLAIRSGSLNFTVAVMRGEDSENAKGVISAGKERVLKNLSSWLQKIDNHIELKSEDEKALLEKTTVETFDMKNGEKSVAYYRLKIDPKTDNSIASMIRSAVEDGLDGAYPKNGPASSSAVADRKDE